MLHELPELQAPLPFHPFLGKYTITYILIRVPENLPMKVVIDRDSCTSCSTCWETCPEFFEQDPDDSFSCVIGKFRLDGDRSQGTPRGEAEACVLDAADLCPVQIIRIEAD